MIIVVFLSVMAHWWEMALSSQEVRFGETTVRETILIRDRHAGAVIPPRPCGHYALPRIKASNLRCPWH
jgi:hypothetical protein